MRKFLKFFRSLKHKMEERATSNELLQMSNEHVQLESSEATTGDDAGPTLERIEENESSPPEETTSQESNTPASSSNRNQYHQQQQQHEHEHEHEQQPINGTLQLARFSRNDSMSRSRASLTSHSRSFRALFHTITNRPPRSPTGGGGGGGVGGGNIAFGFFHRTLNTKSFEQIDCHECAGHKNSVVCMKIYPKPAKNTNASESASILVSGSRDCDIRVLKMETFTKVNI